MNFFRLLDKDLIALLISIICSLILFFNSKSDSVIAVQQDVIDVVNFLTYPQEWYQNIFVIEKQTSDMRNSLVIANSLVKKYILYKNENDLLREMLVLKKSHPLSLVPAKITNQNSISIETITINIGENDTIPIKKNLAVLDISGALLGKTIVVGKNASKVQLITDNNFSVSIRAGNNQSLGNFTPTAGKYGILEGIRKSAKLSLGDIAYTSGISEIYPADIPVARVISVNRDNNKPFQDVIVKILSDFNNLNYIFVVQ